MILAHVLYFVLLGAAGEHLPQEVKLDFYKDRSCLGSCWGRFGQAFLEKLFTSELWQRGIR